MKLNFDNKQEIIRIHKENPENIPFLAKKFNVHISTIYNILRNNNIKPSRKFGPKSRWSDIPEKIKNLLKSGKTYDEVKNELNISKSYISQIARENKLMPEFKGRTKYNVNQNYFNEINTEEKAYFLGLLYADGYVSREYSNYYFCISLKHLDKHILDSFSKAINYTGKLYERLNSYGNKMFSLKVFSKKITEDLEKLGCFQCKSAKIRYPKENQVPKHLVHHFIRGYFDGDGSIHNRKDTRKGVQRKYLKWRINIVSNGFFINEIIEKFLLEKLITAHWVYKPNNIYKELYIEGNNQIRKFYSTIYENATIYLKRKFDKFQIFVNEHEQILNQPRVNWINRKRDENGRFV